jgi:hypothetical protein
MKTQKFPTQKYQEMLGSPVIDSKNLGEDESNFIKTTLDRYQSVLRKELENRKELKQQK